VFLNGVDWLKTEGIMTQQHITGLATYEIKATKFKPAHTGQLGFYLETVDDLLRKEGDNKTIGILLCKSKNKFVAEYALRASKAPIGVSEYLLSKSLPKELKTNLPSVEQLEAELNESTKEHSIQSIGD
jgi:YhcG PDDEXK nuclease domain